MPPVFCGDHKTEPEGISSGRNRVVFYLKSKLTTKSNAILCSNEMYVTVRYPNRDFV